MPVRSLPYASVDALLDAEILSEEDPATRALIERLRRVRGRGAFSRAEFLAMARWKSARAAPHYARNSAAAVRRVSRAVLATRDERRRVEALMSLYGVSVPVASAILTLIDPRRYGVLDIRVWQLLHALGAVDHKPAGRGFVARDWERYLACLRRAARRLGTSVRLVELTLFHCHRRHQVGRLYDPVAAGGRARSGCPVSPRVGDPRPAASGRRSAPRGAASARRTTGAAGDRSNTHPRRVHDL